MFGLLDWIKLGVGALVGAVVAGGISYAVGHASGVTAGRAAEQAAARQAAMVLIQKRGEDDEQISHQDLAGLCAELGGRWVPDENRCD